MSERAQPPAPGERPRRPGAPERPRRPGMPERESVPIPPVGGRERPRRPGMPERESEPGSEGVERKRPRRPGAPERVQPAGPREPGKQAEEEEKGGRGSAWHPGQALFGLLLLGIMIFAFFSVRGLHRPEPPAYAGREVAVRALQVRLHLPNGWKHAEQSTPSGARARWAFGPAGSQQEALFITLYPLPKALREDEKARAAAFKRGLQATGASKLRIQEGELGGEKVLLARLSGSGLRATVWLLSSEREARQITCQYRSESFQRRCRQVAESVRPSKEKK